MHQLSQILQTALAHDREPERLEERSMYIYTSDLIQLEACRTKLNCKLQEEALEIVTPLVAQAWVQALAKHPDKEFRHYIIQGIRQGFHIGFDGSSKGIPGGRSRNWESD